MHEEQNNAPVKTVRSNRQEANFPNLEEKENLKQFYLAQSRRLCPTVSVDRSESQRLGALHHKIKHFIKGSLCAVIAGFLIKNKFGEQYLCDIITVFLKKPVVYRDKADLPYCGKRLLKPYRLRFFAHTKLSHSNAYCAARYKHDLVTHISDIGYNPDQLFDVPEIKLPVTVCERRCSDFYYIAFRFII